MDKETAQRVITLMFECSRTINESAILLQEECSDTEFKAYRTACGKILGEIHTEILTPIFIEHPDLEHMLDS